MPRIETPLRRDRRQQPPSLLALDRERAQTPAAVPGEELVERPLAEPAIAVVQDHQLLAIAAHPALAARRRPRRASGPGGRWPREACWRAASRSSSDPPHREPG